MRAPKHIQKYSIVSQEIRVSPHFVPSKLVIINMAKEFSQTIEEKGEKMRYLAIPVVVLVAITFGCSQMVVQGKAIDRAKVNQLVPGQTQAEKVVEVFGKPDGIEKIASGEEKYVYQYYQLRTRIFKLDNVVKERLDIIIKDNRVQKYNLSAEGVQSLPPESTQAEK